jgi:hypothetical protein
VRIFVLVEGPSETALLEALLPRLLPGHAFRVIEHQGKGKLRKKAKPLQRGLLDQLQPKLRAYGRSLNPETDRVLVLVDADEEDCAVLKGRLTRALARINPRPTVLFRIAIEETEAFYLGDPVAIRAAFPSANLTRLSAYRQDSVCGTWELFREVIGAENEDKVVWAENMGPHLSLDRTGRRANRSPSFHSFRSGCLQLAGEVAE